MSYIRFIQLLLVALLSATVNAASVIVLTDSKQEYEVNGSTVDILKDSTERMTLEEVIRLYALDPSRFHARGPQFIDANASYWLRFTVKDFSGGRFDWLLEFYDNRLDEIELYVPSANEGYEKVALGDLQNFSGKPVQHINFVFPLHLTAEKESVIYVKMHSRHEVYSLGLIRSVERFVAYTTHEYFFVAIFYGILLALATYNLLLLLSVRDRDNTYIYYILYVLSTAFYSLARDGMGFQFLWPDLPQLNTFAEPLGLYCIAITLLLYARQFLETKRINPGLDRLILAAVIVRTVVFVVGLMVSSSFTRNVYLDMPLVLLAYLAGFVSYRKGYQASRYYLIGFTFLLAGFGIILLEALGVSFSGVIAFYSFNMGVVIQFVVLSIALGDRVRILIREKNQAQVTLIQQLKDQEAYKDQLNVQLEQKVKERTRELEDKNNQLDSFVYKASHDIKGPLRSLMGLTKVGLVEFESDKEVSVYFQHIMKTASKLDVVLEDLLTVTKLKTLHLSKTRIDLQAMKEEILDSFSHLSGFERLQVSFHLDEQVPLITDAKVLYSILQNLFENAIKYQDEQKERSVLDVTVTVTPEHAVFVFKDNGCGIQEAHVNRIFDMFYKVNEKSVGSGLGLYILQQAVHKLEGTVQVSSKAGEGSEFTVVLPNVTT